MIMQSFIIVAFVGIIIISTVIIIKLTLVGFEGVLVHSEAWEGQAQARQPAQMALTTIPTYFFMSTSITFGFR